MSRPLRPRGAITIKPSRSQAAVRRATDPRIRRRPTPGPAGGQQSALLGERLLAELSGLSPRTKLPRAGSSSQPVSGLLPIHER